MKKVRLFYYLINFILPYFEEEEEEFSSLLMFCSPTLESWSIFFFSSCALQDLNADLATLLPNRKGVQENQEPLLKKKIGWRMRLQKKLYFF